MPTGEIFNLLAAGDYTECIVIVPRACVRDMCGLVLNATRARGSSTMDALKGCYDKAHKAVAAKLGDEKTSLIEKILIVILVIIVVLMLVNFVLWLLPFIVVGALVYWYLKYYRPRQQAAAAGSGGETAQPASVQVQVVQAAMANPGLTAQVVKAGMAASGPPPPAAAGGAPKMKPPPPSLPEPWTEQHDPSTGRSYYYNTKTGESSWTKP